MDILNREIQDADGYVRPDKVLLAGVGYGAEIAAHIAFHEQTIFGGLYILDRTMPTAIMDQISSGEAQATMPNFEAKKNMFVGLSVFSKDNVAESTKTALQE